MRGWKFTVPEKAGSVEVTPGYQENSGGNENQEVTGEESTLTPEPTAEQSGGNTGAYRNSTAGAGRGIVDTGE